MTKKSVDISKFSFVSTILDTLSEPKDRRGYGYFKSKKQRDIYDKAYNLLEKEGLIKNDNLTNKGKKFQKQLLG